MGTALSTQPAAHLGGQGRSSCRLLLGMEQLSPSKRKAGPKGGCGCQTLQKCNRIYFKAGLCNHLEKLQKAGDPQKEDFPESMIQPNPNHRLCTKVTGLAHPSPSPRALISTSSPKTSALYLQGAFHPTSVALGCVGNMHLGWGGFCM